ncbi:MULTISPECIES: hypothetical protein [Nocardiopsis]|uniref:Uncharacterized protein n=1 Tax=Nocardiopsis sinuspersici TaxID=501010 RepID=A0A1V3C108_9ACTN|nr:MULTISPECIES: hypothetical protein [Nocardiopsis]NYH50495.1 hypothetical protein [Nocardiopsis sinuspersici]OOC54395.1 hypothetical protein NOSIN_11740 [Nocardiopsis sinuspersici]
MLWALPGLAGVCATVWLVAGLGPRSALVWLPGPSAAVLAVCVPGGAVTALRLLAHRHAGRSRS